MATLKHRAIQATDVARDAAANAVQMTNAHTTMIAQHCKLFLRAAFGINPDGTAITNKVSSPQTFEGEEVGEDCRTVQLHHPSPHQLG